jgi:hypothetical protein
MQNIRPNSTSPELIAPCGINCRLCRAYGREKNVCPGCRGDDTEKMKSCLACRIKNCEKLVRGMLEYCYACDEFPCTLLTRLDKRYTGKYGASPVDNLLDIKEFGVAIFVENENRKWICPECGAMICMHQPHCLSCGYAWHEYI